MPKYIIFSDLHLHTWSGEVDNETRLSKRLLLQKSLLQQVIDIAIQEDAIILFGGDLVHAVGDVPVEVINVIHWFFEEIKKCGLKFYAVEGNHDLSIRRNTSHWHSVLSPFQNRSERDRELLTMNPTIKLVDYDDVDDSVYNYKGADILVIHAQPDLVNKHNFHMEGVNWKKLVKNNRLVFFGHDHTRRELCKNGFVIGSPFQLTTNDCGEERGCWLVNSEDWKVEFIKLDYPELQKIEKIEAKKEKIEERIKATSFNDILLEWLAHENKDNSYLDLIKDDLKDKIQDNKTLFKGRIQKVYVKDFLSFDEITFEFKNGFWLVLGENGAGKTTIFESLMWILWDETTKKLAKSEVIRNRPTKQKDAYGELELRDDKIYTIKRSVKNGLEVISEGKNLVEGMTKIQAQEFLEKNILGFDKNTYLASCYFSQEGLLTLAQLGDAETTNLVTDLLGFETYDELHNLMALKAKEIEVNLSVLEQDKQKLENDIWKNNEQQKSLKEQIEMFTKQECSLKDEQSKVNQQLSEFKDLLVKIVIPTVTTEEVDKVISELNVHKSEMSTKYKTLQESRQLKLNELRMKQNLEQTKLRNILQEQAKIDKEKTKIETEKRLIAENIAKHEAIIKSLEENKCSYCGAILNKEDMEKHLGEEMAEIALLKSQLTVIPQDFDKQLESFYDQEASIQEEIQKFEDEFKKIDAENKEAISLFNAEIKVIEDKIKEQQEKKVTLVKEVTEANSRKANLTSQIKQLEQRQLTLVNQLKEVNINDKLLQLKELENNLTVLKDRTVDLQNRTALLTTNKEIYKFWQNAYSNKGIRPLLLDRFVNEVNNVIHHYCYEVSNGQFLVEFNPTSKTRAGLERNKLDLQVRYQDKVVPYSGLSGGEKTRANLPLCLGLNAWISKKYGIKNGLFGLVILDELFANLDIKGRENVANLLNEEGRNRSIYVIDHSPTLESYTQNIIQVSKENEVTNIQEI